ncbi:Lrp/AsnC ligand binding domain-containing protein [Pontixanthobacter sp.]|uniref:Lrp/AsnC ligand binding domain-containing protein n=1 Tax=Pontixanthobacter sp. TaxID=2792078 RepID=UPI003C79E1EA
MKRIALDKIDLQLLQCIQEDGRISVVELAKRIHLSKTPCLKRLRGLEDQGIIEGYSARLNPRKLDQGYLVYNQVKLSSTSRASLEEFNRAVKDVPAIISCHMMSGGYDYLLKVRTRDMDGYRILIGDVISQLPFVEQTSSFPVMEEVKDTHHVPIFV